MPSKNKTITLNKEDLEALVDGLSFYAEPDTYHAISFFVDPPCGDFYKDVSEDEYTVEYNRPMPGKLARKTLTSFVEKYKPELQALFKDDE